MAPFLRIWLILVLVIAYVCTAIATQLYGSSTGLVILALAILALLFSRLRSLEPTSFWWWRINGEVQEGEEAQVDEVEDSQ